MTVSTPVKEVEEGGMALHKWRYDGTLATTVCGLCVGSLGVLRHFDRGWRFLVGG